MTTIDALVGWGGAIALLAFAVAVMRLQSVRWVAIALTGATVTNAGLLWWLDCPQLAAALLVTGTPSAALLALAAHSLDVPVLPVPRAAAPSRDAHTRRGPRLTRNALVQGLVGLATLLLLLLAVLGTSWRVPSTPGESGDAGLGMGLANEGLSLLSLAACLLAICGIGCTIVLASPPSAARDDLEPTSERGEVER